MSGKVNLPISSIVIEWSRRICKPERDQMLFIAKNPFEPIHKEFTDTFEIPIILPHLPHHVETVEESYIIWLELKIRVLYSNINF